MKKRVVVIGDSHSQLFDNNYKLNRGVWSSDEFDIFDVRWLGPVTYWRLCRDQNNFIDFNKDILYTPHIGMTTTTMIDKDSEIMISLGEIDIRCNIGRQINTKDSIDKMALLIDSFLSNYYDFKINLVSIIPPIKKEDCISSNSDFPFIGSNEERLENTIYFNERLNQICDDYKFGYFDTYSLYKDNDGFLDINKSDKIVHGVKNKSLEEYIKKYFKI